MGSELSITFSVFTVLPVPLNFPMSLAVRASRADFRPELLRDFACGFGVSGSLPKSNPSCDSASSSASSGESTAKSNSLSKSILSSSPGPSYSSRPLRSSSSSSTSRKILFLYFSSILLSISLTVSEDSKVTAMMSSSIP